MIFTVLTFLCMGDSASAFQRDGDRYTDRYRNWIKVIGSDEFGGRKPMTEFETKTIEYLAGEFRSLGLEPAFGDSYFQSVKEISTTVTLPEKGIPVKAAKGSFKLSSPNDLMLWTTRGTDRVEFKDAEYVFCGFGIDAPEYGWNDFDGIDVKGKIVIAMVNDPGFYDKSLFRGRNMTYYGRWTYKLEQAQKLGAAGCLILHNEAAAGYGWHVCVNGHQKSNLALFDEADGNLDELGVRGWISEEGCRKLFEKAGLDYDNAVLAAKKPGFRAIPLKARSSFSMDVKYEVGETFNVGAVLPGTDLKDECVVYSAHWDHFGIGTPDETGDAIYNGAADNGSGLAALLMIAAKLQTMPAPRRSILFLAATSEESGLFGSQYYCEHPAFPMEKTAACFNFDCIAPAPLTGEVALLGGGESTLDNYVIAAAAAQGRKIIFDDDNSDGWFFRSDHWNFVKRGVPAVIFKAGKMGSWYHKPSDEYSEDWDVEGSVANVNLMFSAGLGVANADGPGLSRYVNPFIGASTSIDAAGVYHGLGKTFPGATTPFGMTQVSPNTITGGDNGPGYSDEHRTIEGFAFTQMSGIGWYGDLGNLLTMPTTGSLHTVAGKEDGSLKGWRSAYDKESETASAGYYSALLTDYGILAEATASPHGGVLRFTYPESKTSRIQIDLSRRVGGCSERQSVNVIDDHTIEGWMLCTPEGGGWGDGAGNARYTVFFHAEFSKPFSKYGFWSADIPDDWSRHNRDVASLKYQKKVAKAGIIHGRSEMEGKHIGFYAEFPTEESEQVCMKAAISFVDLAGASRNFEAELAGKSFDDIHAAAVAMWDKALSKLSVEGGSEDDRTIFYTALYHTMIDPRLYSDVDGRYVGGDYRIHNTGDTFSKRTIFSGWDVFRSQMPLNTITNPQVTVDVINSLTALAEESGRGYYERWEFLNAYSGCMIGNPAISVIADAYVKGIRNFDLQKVYGICRNTSAKFGNAPCGYTPSSVSSTLENAYTDWCVSLLADACGDAAGKREYLEKGQAYRNLFDTGTGWFRPRAADGSFLPLPEEGRYKEGYGCVESNPFQQGWFVPHDINGLVELLGGRQKALEELDFMFNRTPLDFRWNQYYNHANEPVHFIPFLYNALGEPYKTQKWTRTICRNAYFNAVEGLCGNEDCGQMSAWYILAASGIHPLCPGSTRMEITSPMFSKVEFVLDPVYHKGRKFTILAHDNSDTNIYIQKAALDGKPLENCFIDYSDIAEGGKLELWMGPDPSAWGVKSRDFM